ncbi:transcriptional regulator [Lapidilactobacillus dextrinicus]|uniref:transcriptional regulator n=1 Tax=Lapidilactobacillus dextrinicus TaxID=51664 RepID=UPI003F268B59
MELIILDRAVYSHIEKLLRDYPKTDKLIKDKQGSIMYPFYERDDNIGGGKRNTPSNRTETMIITIADDKYIQNLKAVKSIIDDCLARCDNDTVRIINELYFKSHSPETITSLSIKLHTSRTSISRKRTAVFKAIQLQLGW